MFTLQTKEGSKPYQALSRHSMYALQQSFRKELERLQKQQVVMSLEIDELSDWCNSIVLVSKPNMNIWLCLDPTRLNQMPIELVHRALTINEIQPCLANMKYLMIIEANSGYHSLNLDDKSLYLATFACGFGRFRYVRMLFGADLAGERFQRKMKYSRPTKCIQHCR